MRHFVLVTRAAAAAAPRCEIPRDRFEPGEQKREATKKEEEMSDQIGDFGIGKKLGNLEQLLVPRFITGLVNILVDQSQCNFVLEIQFGTPDQILAKNC